MKKSKFILTTISLLTLVVTGTFVTVAANENGGWLLYRNAGADDYHLSFDSDDAVSASDITAGYKTLDQYTTLSFAGASTSASGFIDLAASTGVLKKR